MSHADISDLLGDEPSTKRSVRRAPGGQGPKDSGIALLVKALGGPAQAAIKADVTRQSVYVWLRDGFVTPERAIDLERRFKVSRWDLMSPEAVALWGGRAKSA